jgi:ABC transporter DrrB family efflux protein
MTAPTSPSLVGVKVPPPPLLANASRPSAKQKLRWAVADTLTLTRRSMLLWVRIPTVLVFTVVQPVMFVLLFRYVFGGAINSGVKGGYVNYLMPGIIGQSAAFGSFATAIALSREIEHGAIDRFRSMPMARSAVLVGRLLSDGLRLVVTVLVILGVGYAVGFRFENGFGPAVAMVALGVILGVAFCCVSAFVGLAIKDEESVSSFGLIWLFPLTFISSAFVQVATMPGWLQAFANNQPVTIVIDEMRAMALGGPLVLHLWQSAVWLLGIVVVFVVLAVRSYKKV